MFVGRDPRLMGIAASFDRNEGIADTSLLNPYEFLSSQPLTMTYLSGEASRAWRSATGPCEIKIWFGDTLDSETSLRNFYKDNTGENAFKGNEDRICQSQYLGVIGCGLFGPGGKATGSNRLHSARTK